MSDTVKEIAERLVETREALGLNQVKFCEELDITKTLYNPFERGRRRVTIDVAVKIRKRFGVPLDWIYCGDPEGLPARIYKKLASRAA